MRSPWRQTLALYGVLVLTGVLVWYQHRLLAEIHTLRSLAMVATTTQQFLVSLSYAGLRHCSMACPPQPVSCFALMEADHGEE